MLYSVWPTGVRNSLAAVGWIQRKVRLAQYRDILFDLCNTLQVLTSSEENRPARLNLLKTLSNLQRLWID